MIRVTIELVPFGVEERKEVLGIVEVANDGTGNRETGNYIAKEVGSQHTFRIRHQRRGPGLWKELLGRVFTRMSEVDNPATPKVG